MCTPIHSTPRANSHGFSSSASRSICMPMQAIRKYRNIEPHFDAPTPSSSRARVKLRPRPMKVASSTTQPTQAAKKAMTAKDST